jgi:hypothetical protein
MNSIFKKTVRQIFQKQFYSTQNLYVKFNPKKKKLTHKEKMFIVREQHILQNTKVEDIALNTLADNPGSKKPVKLKFKLKNFREEELDVVLVLEGLQQEEEKDKKQDPAIQFQLVLKEVKVELT